MSYMARQERRIGRVVRGKKAQRLTETQQRETIAPAPIVGGRAAVPEQPVVLLQARVEQKARQQIEVAGLTTEPEGPTEHGTIHEHVLGAEVWVGRRWRAAIDAWPIALGDTDEEVGIAAVAADFGKLHTPDQPRQG